MAKALVHFVVDGAIDQPTGGYIYDRLVIERMRARGANIEVHGLGRGVLRENIRLAAIAASCGDDDILVIDELSHPRAVLASLVHVARRRGRLIALVHHLAANETSGARAFARLTIERPLLSAADDVIVTSTTTRDVVIATGVAEERIHVVLPGRDRLGERSSPPAREGRVRFLFLGSLTPRKRALPLVRAFLSHAAKHATLTIVGPLDRDRGYAADVLDAARSSASIRVTGTLTDREVEAELDRHDALVMPSSYEGFGISLAEALAHGLAIVATRAGAIPEVVRDGREAILIDPRSESALSDALARVAVDGELLASMQRDAIARAKDIPTWNDAGDAFAKALGLDLAKES